MRINHNISALRANNQLSRTNNKLDASLERLSSGYRINSAADDAAGLAISEKMRTQIAGLDQASRNASDGISVIQTAEGALIEVEAMLQRMRELSVQSANGTYTTEDRSAIQAEIDQLNKEIQRISDTTEFNKMTLLDGKIDRKSYSSNNQVNLISLSDSVDIGEYAIKITQDARQAVILGNTTNFTGPTSDRKITAAEAGSININGESVTIEEGDTLDEVFEKIRNACDSVNVNVFATAAGAVPSTTDNLDMAGYTSKSLAGGDKLVFVSRDYGSDQNINLYCDSPALCDLLGLTIKGASASGYDAKAELVLNSAASDSLFENTATVSIKGNMITVSDRNDFKMVFQVDPGTVGSVFTDASITGSSDEISMSYPPNTIISGDYGITVTQDARQAVIVGNTTVFSDTDPQPANRTVTADEAGTITINGQTITVAAGDSIQDIYAQIQAACSAQGLSANAIDGNAVPSATDHLATAGYTTKAGFAAGDRLLFLSDDYGSSESISITCDDPDLAKIFGLTTAGATAAGYDAEVNLAANSVGKGTAVVSGNIVTITDAEGNTKTVDVSAVHIGTEYTDSHITSANLAATAGAADVPAIDIVVSVLDAGPMDLQIGANEGQIMSIRIPKVNPQTLGIDKVNIGTADGAQEAISLLDIAINEVSSIRSKLGAYQNRLEHSISNLDVTSENMTESLSRIEDVDMAEEMAEYTQKNVLAQAGTAMLAQANQRPQQILSLIQG